jgi:hypothetical protein
MKAFSVVLAVKSKSHNVAEITKALGVAPDADGGSRRKKSSRRTWLLTPTEGDSFSERTRQLLRMLPPNFAFRLARLKGASGVLSIALSTDEETPVAFTLPKWLLRDITHLRLSLEVRVIPPCLWSKENYFAA